jgi:dTDP-4-amino-4,6-dideoxygalactose transaminase
MMRKKRRIPYAVPSWGWPEHMAICRCLLTGRIIEGSDIDALVDFMRTLTGVPFIFGFESGETAILTGLKAAGGGAETEWPCGFYVVFTAPKKVHCMLCD